MKKGFTILITFSDGQIGAVMKHIDALQVKRGRAFIFCCVVTLGKLADIAIRYYSGQLVDNGTGREKFMAVLPGITAICGINLLLQYLGPYVGDCFEASYTGTLFSRLEDKILYARQEQIDKRNIGEFSTCFSSDVYGILQFVKRTLQVLVPDIISFVICIFLLVNMKPALGATALVSGLASAFFMSKLSKNMVKSLNDYQDKLKVINGLTSDGLFNLEMVKVNMMEKGLSERYGDELRQLHRIKKKAAFRQAVLSVPTMTLSFVTLTTVAFCGGYFVIADQMSIGQLLSAVTLSDYVVSPIMRFENTLVQYRRAAVNLKNFSRFEEMEMEEGHSSEKESVPEIKVGTTGSGKTECFRSDAECGISGLCFHYPDGTNIFDGLNMNFEKGKINYIVGNNGSGKSTLIKIIGGIYEADSGEISLPVKGSGRTVREAVSIMTQDSLVFADSIRANLLAGTSASEEKMYGMCRELGLHDEIQGMENGYDTILQEKGAPLSGGQKKRISFIRSALHEAEVYIFDEPTVSVDMENSVRMMEYISGLARRHYVIMITHDREMMDRYPGTIQDMNEAGAL